MLKYVRASFKERLDNNTWLDDTTRDRCKEKVDAVSTFTSYPNQLFDDNYLNNLYVKVCLYNIVCPDIPLWALALHDFAMVQYKINATDFFGNFQGAKILQFRDTLRNLHQHVDKEKVMWSSPPTQVNAFYNAVVNSLSEWTVWQCYSIGSLSECINYYYS